MKEITKLLNIPFKAKKGTSAYETFKKSDIYISEINEYGELCLSNLTPKQREDTDYAEKHEVGSAWHDESELINKPVETTNELPKTSKKYLKDKIIGKLSICSEEELEYLLDCIESDIG